MPQTELPVETWTLLHHGFAGVTAAADAGNQIEVDAAAYSGGKRTRFQGAAVLGVVTGLTAEARISRPLGRIATGAGPASATAAAERLVTDGARALLSFGLAGGLDPDLRPGALLLPETVVDDGATFGVDRALRTVLGGGIAGRLLATDKPISGAGYKALLHRMTGAVAVDMESGAVARVAARHRLPFAVLRAVCDPADCTLAPVALAGFGAQGGVAIGRVLAALLREPGALPALLALARNAARARHSLLCRVRELGEPGRSGQELWNRG